MMAYYVAGVVGVVVLAVVLTACFNKRFKDVLKRFRDDLKQKLQSKKANAVARYYKLMRAPDDVAIKDWSEKVWNRYTAEDNNKPALPPSLSLVLTGEQLETAKKEFDEAEAKRKGIQRKSNVDASEKDRAIAYLERIVDRIINKARGILPFNSMLVTLLGIQVTVFHIQLYFTGFASWMFNTFAALALMMLVASSLLLLILFVVHWGEPSKFADFKAEFAYTAEIIRKRGALLQATIILSMCGLVCMVVLVVMASWAGGGISDAIRDMIAKEKQVQQIEQDKLQQTQHGVPKADEKTQKGDQKDAPNPAPPKAVAPAPITAPK